MTIEEISKLLDLFHSSGVAEMEVQRGENRVRFRRGPEFQDYVTGPAPVGAPIAAPRSVAAPAPAAQPEPETNTTNITSPIVGTFYESPSPDKPAFVKVGDEVIVGQVLCIIESMKLMNEIEAEIAGTITARLVENGKAVEYGQPLFSIRPR